MRTSPLGQSASRFVSTALAATVVGLAAPAAAQSDPPLGDFSVFRYSPAPGPNNYLQVDGAIVRGELEPSIGLQLDYAHEPLRLYQATNCSTPLGTDGCQAGGTLRTPVQVAFAAHIWGAIAIAQRFQIGLVVPVAVVSGDDFDADIDGDGLLEENLLEGGTTGGLADPRLHLKVAIFEDPSSGFRLGAVAYVTAPIGHAIAPGHFLGDEQPMFGGHLVAEIVNSGVHAAVNLGGLWRDGDTVFSTAALGQLTYAAAIGYDITPLVQLFVEGAGGTSFTSSAQDNPFELRIGGRIRVDDVYFELGGGPGVVPGAGTPVFRLLGGFAWAPQRADTDGDQLEDTVDHCPSEAEDLDGFHDEDGCPEVDNDGDGINDETDACPADAEDMDGDHDEDGCPDQDTDGDGIQDGYDSCPSVPEDMDGDRDDDGCPDEDRDRDNIPDAADQCPDEAEDTDGYGDEDGCPETDFDSDGMLDDGDACPDQAEDVDGVEDDDGCPEEAGPPAGGGREGGRRRRRGGGE